MAQYKITFNRKDCIGVLACVAMSQKFWLISEDGKVDLKGGEQSPKTGFWELTINESDFNEMLESASVCPVNVIIIDRIEDNGEIKRIYPEEKSQ